MSEGWQSAYVAVSVALGDPLDGALASLGDAARAGAAASAARLAAELRSPLRQERARALARAVSPIALAVEATALA